MSLIKFHTFSMIPKLLNSISKFYASYNFVTVPLKSLAQSGEIQLSHITTILMFIY